MNICKLIVPPHARDWQLLQNHAQYLGFIDHQLLLSVTITPKPFKPPNPMLRFFATQTKLRTGNKLEHHSENYPKALLSKKKKTL